MATETLKEMKDQLVSCIQGELNDIAHADAHELGEAIDMVKDLAEAIYYCTITDSMEKSEENSKGDTNINYYTTPMYNKMYPNYDDKRMGNNMMYYPEVSGDMLRDPREGRSPMRRRMYMEGKEMHNDVNSQLHELEAYLQELSTDITEMIKDASPEEKATLRQKMTTLTDKII